MRRLGGGGKWGEKLRLVKLGQCLVMTIKLFIIVEFQIFTDAPFRLLDAPFRLLDASLILTLYMNMITPEAAFIKFFFDLNSLGEYDHLPEAAFYMVGDISDVIEKADRLAEEHAS